MTAKQLFDAGRVKEAAKAVGEYLRGNPTDIRQRTFLFELLCFAGEYDRAEKHLTLLAQAGGPSELGAVMYFSALHADRSRNELFAAGQFPEEAKHSPSGTLNGEPFSSLSDIDPRIGARLEVYAAGAYLWIGFEHIQAIKMGPPRRLRDTLWAPATVLTGPSFKGTELGEVLVPVIYPFSWKHENEEVWLGRVTDWREDRDGYDVPAGQKMLLVDDREVSLLEVRAIEFSAAQAAAH
jgi:type VI secretion system protein ImpE